MHFLHDIINILSCSLIFIFFTFLLRGDKLCFTYITRQTSFIYFLLQQKKVTKKTCSVFKLFRYAMPDVVTAPSAIIKIFSQTAYPSPLNAARSSTDSLCSPTPGVPLAFLVTQSVDFPFNFATYPIANTKWKRVSLASRQFLAFAHFAFAREPLLVRGANRP